ncbi:MAG TPA: histidine kinase [Bryobacteraceae bacterium]|jgi:two-component system LytT family sensor kinase|nr:histidine kinase [Bryobacteraceae bacterium]
MNSRTGKFVARLLLIWAAWTAYAVFSASQNYLTRAYTAKVEWKPALQYALLDSYVWAALTPAVLYLAGRVLVRRANWWRALPLLFLAGIVFAVIHLNVFTRLLPFIGYQNSFRARQVVFMAKFHSALLTCWVLFGARHAMEYYRQVRIRELKATQLEARLALSQLEVLKMQLQPHFLFNTLHAISALMYRNLEGADRMIARLSDFLRLTLDSAGVQEVTLKREMEYLDKYLEIEQVRFGERLEVRRAIDPGALDLLLPNLVLQPLVENAVRHGIAPRAGGGQIEVTARVDQSTLVVEVLDDGPGPTGEIREGLGLSNTRARLEQLYGKECRLELAGAPQGGFRARLIIPAHSESQHANPDRRR